MREIEFGDGRLSRHGDVPDESSSAVKLSSLLKMKRRHNQ